MSATNPFAAKEEKTYNTKDTQRIAELWKVLYKNHINVNYKIDVAEKSCLKKLITEYGVADVEKVVNYYFENYQSISYMKGFPSIKAMMGFRRSLFPEALSGITVGDKKGQFSESTLKDDHLWKSNKKISKEDSHGSNKKACW